MKERGILFSAPMVRALLAGAKTQTRRALKLPPAVVKRGIHPRMDEWMPNRYTKGSGQYAGGNPDFTGDQPPGLLVTCLDGTCQRVPCLYGVPGDRLWVRETWARRLDEDHLSPSELKPGWAWYWADSQTCNTGCAGAAGKRRVSIHMPRWASRITLEVTEVRVQRLQSISEEDAQAEGLTCLSKDGGRTFKWGIPDRDGLPGQDDDGEHWQKWSLTARDAYARLWDDINGAGSWASNPWVWALSFRRIAQ